MDLTQEEQVYIQEQLNAITSPELDSNGLIPIDDFIVIMVEATKIQQDLKKAPRRAHQTLRRELLKQNQNEEYAKEMGKFVQLKQKHAGAVQMGIVQTLGLPEGTLKRTSEIYQTDTEIKLKIEVSIKKAKEAAKKQMIEQNVNPPLSEEDTLKYMAKMTLDLQRLRRFVEIEKNLKDGKFKKEPGLAKFMFKVETNKAYDRLFEEFGVEQDDLIRCTRIFKVTEGEEWEVIKKEVEEAKEKLLEQLLAATVWPTK